MEKRKWYRFYIFLPEDYNSIDPGNMSFIQWKRFDPSRVLVMFKHTKNGLIFERHSQSLQPTGIFYLKKNDELYGNWTEIIFATNWHPDPKKGFMKVWIDGKLKVDVKNRSNHKEGRELSLRFGLYSSFLKRYREAKKTNIHPQRIIFFDGVRVEKNCKKLFDENQCQKLTSQTVK